MTKYCLRYQVSDRVALTDGSMTRFQGMDFEIADEVAARVKAQELWRDLKLKHRDEAYGPSLDELTPMRSGGYSLRTLDWSPVLN